MAVTPLKLSGSTNGRGISLATSVAGTTLHTTATATGASKFDEIYVWVANFATVGRVVQMHIGSTGGADVVLDTIPPRAGFVQVLHGVRLSGGLLVRGKAGFANVLYAFGVVNRNS